MIWATRALRREGVLSIEALFRDQAASLRDTGRMLLVSVDEEWPAIRLWVALPEFDLLGAYHGFALCLRPDLPVAPTLVAGSSAEFARVFHGRHHEAGSAWYSDV